MLPPEKHEVELNCRLPCMDLTTTIRSPDLKNLNPKSKLEILLKAQGHTSWRLKHVEAKASNRRNSRPKDHQ